MTTSQLTPALVVALLSGVALAAIPDLAHAQQGYSTYPQTVPGYTYQEVGSMYSGTPLLFGVAAYKICQLKSFLFAGVYVLGAIAFVIFAVRALFTKFEMKHFIPILGSLFIVATADLFIYWMSSDAFYCPTAISTFSGQ